MSNSFNAFKTSILLGGKVVKVKNVLSNVLTDLNENSSTCFIFSQKANNVEIIKLLRKSFCFSSSAPNFGTISTVSSEKYYPMFGV